MSPCSFLPVFRCGFRLRILFILTNLLNGEISPRLRSKYFFSGSPLRCKNLSIDGEREGPHAGGTKFKLL
jgi:hypothetical protein